MSFEFLLRLIGMVVFAFVGLQLGMFMAGVADDTDSAEIWALVTSLIGALFGLILTPYFTTRPARILRAYLNQLPAQQLVAGTIGLVLGLTIAALLAPPLSLLPKPYNAISPGIAAVVFGYFG